jgi:hypothetical protein
VVQGCQSCFTSLAADRVSAARPHHTFTPLLHHPRPKTRARNFCRQASGRLSRRGARTPIITPGFRACGYKSASGRRQWLNRDPLGDLAALPNFVPLLNRPIGSDSDNVISADGLLNLWCKINLNLYGAMANDPLNFFDPYGFCEGYGNPVSGPNGVVGPSSPYAPGGAYYVYANPDKTEATAVANAAQNAWDKITGGLSGAQISPGSYNFAKLNDLLLAMDTASFQQDQSIHTGYSISSPIPGSQDFVLKLYFNPNGIAAAVTPPTWGFRHFLGVPPYLLGYPINYDYAKAYLATCTNQ